MSGLMLKDLLVNKKYLQTGGFLLIFYIAYAIFTDYLGFINMAIILLTTMFVLTTFSYDDIAKWNTYALTMPTTRKYIILSKYALTLCVAFVGSVLCLIIQCIYSIFITQSFAIETFVIIGVCFIVAVLFNCLLIPIVIKIGVERARIAILAIVLISTILLMFFNKLNIQVPWVHILNIILPYIPYISIIVSTLFYFLSLAISQKIFASKEF